MAKKKIETKDAPEPAGAYSKGLIAGNMVFVAGQIGKNPATGKIESDTIEGQTEQVMKNVEAVLKAAGASLDDVVKTTAHIDDISKAKAFNEVYKKFFKEPLPVRTTVGSQLIPGVQVEVDVIAVKE
jgi:2-iminobutanoate/2-iminopropanoate deaminase